MLGGGGGGHGNTDGRDVLYRLRPVPEDDRGRILSEFSSLTGVFPTVGEDDAPAGLPEGLGGRIEDLPLSEAILAATLEAPPLLEESFKRAATEPMFGCLG